RDSGHAPDASHIVGDAIFAVASGAEVHADDSVRTILQPGKRRRLSLIVEAEAVDDGVVPSGAKNAGPRIAALCQGRQRAHLDEAEAHGEKLARHTRILVETGRQADGIGEIQAEHGLGQAPVVRAFGARIEPKLEALDGDVVGALGIERLQQRLAEPEQQTHAKTPSGRTWRPSGPRVSGSLHSTAASSSGA